MLRFLVILSVLLTFESTAFGAKTFDLQTILSNQQTHQAGDRYRTTTQSTKRASYSPRQAGTHLEAVERVENDAIGVDFITEILQVDSNGRATQKVVTYNQFESSNLNGPLQVVKGIRVQFQQAHNGQRFEYQQIAGPAIPRALKDELNAEIEQLSRTDNPDAKRIQQLLPTDSVSVGKSWSIDVIPFLEAMDAPITPSTKRSKGRGSIERIDTIDDRDFLTLHFEIRAKLENINDMPCKSSCVLEMQLDLQVPVDGRAGHSMMANSVRLTGRFGAPQADDPNMVDIDLERTDIETNVPEPPLD